MVEVAPMLLFQAFGSPIQLDPCIGDTSKCLWSGRLGDPSVRARLNSHEDHLAKDDVIHGGVRRTSQGACSQVIRDLRG